MVEQVKGLLRNKGQRRFLVWLAVVCLCAAAAVGLLFLCLFNDGKTAAVFAWDVKGKKLALLLALATFVVGLALGLLLRLRPVGRRLADRKPWAQWLALALYALAVPFVLNLAGEMVIKGSVGMLAWLPGYFLYFLRGWIFLALCYLLVAVLANGWVASLVSGLITVVPAAISYFKLQYRGNPVFPWDIYALDTFNDIAGDIELHVTLALLAALALWALAVAAAVPLRCPWRWRERAGARGKRFGWKRACALVGAAGLVVGYTWLLFFNESLVLESSNWLADATYKKRGQVTAFLTDVKMLFPTAPAGYSAAAVQAVMPAVPAAGGADETERQPNIIMIMGESFWDIEEKLPGIAFEEELLPNLRRMQREALSGELLVSVHTGGTSTTEFQVLTGFTTQFFPAEYTPYVQAVRRPFFSYAQYLKNQGYATAAIHAHKRKNWNRSSAYPYLGFDAFYSIDDDQGSFEKKLRARGFRSDAGLADELLKRYEEHVGASDEPLFLFGVTVQNHPAYKSGKYKPEQWVKFNAEDMSPAIEDQLLDMATGLHSADAVIGELLAYFEAREEPVLLIYFGDHQSANQGTMPQLYTGLGEKGTGTDWQYDPYLVPFFAWGNDGGNIAQDLGVMAAYNLLPQVLDAYGLPMPQFFEYLLELEDVSPGFEKGLALKPDGAYTPIGMMDAAQAEAYRAYELLQYDYIFGKQYAGALFADGER